MARARRARRELTGAERRCHFIEKGNVFAMIDEFLILSRDGRKAEAEALLRRAATLKGKL